MCVHGIVGLAVTLEYLGQLTPGQHQIDTPVGSVKIQSLGHGKVAVENVASYRTHENIPLEVEGYGTRRADIAWGGNWFCLIDSNDQPKVHLDNLDELLTFSKAVKSSLAKNNITGDDGGDIDHIEVFSSGNENYHSKNYVLCPGDEYDRSPCGTGTSAKLACLAASGQLAPGETWRQAGICGSIFEGSYKALDNGKILPTVTAQAWVNGDTQIILNPKDLFQHGIKPL